MRKLFPIFFFALLFVSCFGKNRVPNGILSHEKMQAVLWDMLRADEFLGVYVLAKDSSLNNKQESALMFDQVLRIHKCSKEEFNKSLLFYQSHPEIFKIVLDSLYARQSVLDSGNINFSKSDSNLSRRIKTMKPQ